MKPKLPQSYKKLWAGKKRSLKMYGITVFRVIKKDFVQGWGRFVTLFIVCAKICQGITQKWIKLVLSCNLSLKLQNSTLGFYNSSLGL